MTEEKQSIFLDNGSILPWDRPLKRGYQMSYLFDGSTKLVEQIGFDTLDETIGDYRVRASAVKYLADIIHIETGKSCIRLPGQEVSGEEKREILFSGELVIYRVGQIPGTEIQGYDFEQLGRIWVAKTPGDKYTCKDGLRNLVFEESNNPVGQIEAILEGYETQKRAQIESQIRVKYHSFVDGKRDGESGHDF